jgi:hypothetical protein
VYEVSKFRIKRNVEEKPKKRSKIKDDKEE